MKKFETKKETNLLHFIEHDSSFDKRIHDTVDFLIENQYSKTRLWKTFVDQYRGQPDAKDNGWRGEFWGKSLRGAALIYEYSHSESLYAAMTETVKDMLTAVDRNGRVSSYTVEKELICWDIWCRKYVMLGMEYYYDICKDEALKKDILSFVSLCADYLIEHIGEEDGKRGITESERWKGMNSSSVLEPIIRLYVLTEDKKYLDFAAYIVRCGGADGINIFELAYENKKYPYRYGTAKAYEMISCFEGMVEYYRVTKNEKARIIAVNFGKAVIDSDVTIIGSCGCTHELFDHSKLRQTVFYDGVMQETCVTVTWMKFCSQLLRLTGDPVYADCMEQSFFNAYLGSVNTQKKISPYMEEKYIREQGLPRLAHTNLLPFDSYNPLTAGKRGQKVGGNMFFSNDTYYGCCAAIGGAGLGIYLKSAMMCSDNGIVINFYHNGKQTVSFGEHMLTVDMTTEYPADGKIKIKLSGDLPLPYTVSCRIPKWSRHTKVQPIAEEQKADGGYILFHVNSPAFEINLALDMQIRVERPEKWDTDVLYTDAHGPTKIVPPLTVTQKDEELQYMALSRGPLVLCADSKLGKAANSVFEIDPASMELTEKQSFAADHGMSDLPYVVCKFKDGNEGSVYLIDYASAGKNWNEEIAAWLKTK